MHLYVLLFVTLVSNLESACITEWSSQFSHQVKANKCNSNLTMAPLKQFCISYINGGRRKETQYRIPDIEAVLNRHQPHALFVPESLLNNRTKKKMEYHGFNVEEMAFKTKEKRI